MYRVNKATKTRTTENALSIISMGKLFNSIVTIVRSGRSHRFVVGIWVASAVAANMAECFRLRSTTEPSCAMFVAHETS